MLPCCLKETLNEEKSNYSAKILLFSQWNTSQKQQWWEKRSKDDSVVNSPSSGPPVHAVQASSSGADVGSPPLRPPSLSNRQISNLWPRTSTQKPNLSRNEGKYLLRVFQSTFPTDSQLRCMNVKSAGREELPVHQLVKNGTLNLCCVLRHNASWRRLPALPGPKQQNWSEYPSPRRRWKKTSWMLWRFDPSRCWGHPDGDATWTLLWNTTERSFPWRHVQDVAYGGRLVPLKTNKILL